MKLLSKRTVYFTQYSVEYNGQRFLRTVHHKPNMKDVVKWAFANNPQRLFDDALLTEQADSALLAALEQEFSCIG